MIAHVYKPKRMREGKRMVGRLYRAKYRIKGESKIRDVLLGVSDRQVAQQKLATIIRDCEKEACGMIPAQSVRDSLQKPLPEHVRDFVNDLKAQGRNPRHIRQVQTRSYNWRLTAHGKPPKRSLRIRFKRGERSKKRRRRR